MRRNEQVRRIRVLDAELDVYLERAGKSSRRPMATIHRHVRWLAPGAGLIMGALVARVSTRNMVARGVSVALLILRAQRLVFKWMRRA